MTAAILAWTLAAIDATSWPVTFPRPRRRITGRQRTRRLWRKRGRR